MRQDEWRRYVAPAAFLLAVTIAIVLIRAGINAGGSTKPGADRAGPHTTTNDPEGRPREAVLDGPCG